MGHFESSPQEERKRGSGERLQAGTSTWAELIQTQSKLFHQWCIVHNIIKQTALRPSVSLAQRTVQQAASSAAESTREHLLTLSPGHINTTHRLIIVTDIRPALLVTQHLSHGKVHIHKKLSCTTSFTGLTSLIGCSSSWQWQFTGVWTAALHHTYRTTVYRSLVLTLGGICVPSTVSY